MIRQYRFTVNNPNWDRHENLMNHHRVQGLLTSKGFEYSSVYNPLNDTWELITETPNNLKAREFETLLDLVVEHHGGAFLEKRELVGQNSMRLEN